MSPSLSRFLSFVTPCHILLASSYTHTQTHTPTHTRPYIHRLPALSDFFFFIAAQINQQLPASV